MPARDFFGVLRRRWLLILVGFVLTVGLSGAAYELFKPTYEITGTVLLLPPASSATTGNVNPYLELGGLRQAVDLVGVSLTDQPTQLELQAISKNVQFTVQADPRTSSPLLLIDVKDSSAQTALQIRDILVDRVPSRLQDMQQTLGVAANDRVTSTVVTLDVQAQEVGRNRLRAAVVAAIGGLGLTIVVATLWDARRQRRPRRRASKGPGTGLDPGTPPPTEEPDALEEMTDDVPVSPGEPGSDAGDLEERADGPADAHL